MSQQSDIVHLRLKPAPAGKPQGQAFLHAGGVAMTFRRNGVVPMERKLAQAFVDKYNRQTGDFRGIFFFVEEVNPGAPAPEPSADISELQALVRTQQTQIESLTAMMRTLIDRDAAKPAAESVHPKAASPAVQAEAAKDIKAKPKKGAMTRSSFATEEG